jgi:hypothetical protein
MLDCALTYAETAVMLRISIHTLRGWMKPNGPNDAPDMAVDLLCLKTGADLPPWIEPADLPTDE